MNILKRRWLQIFVSGIVLLYLLENALVRTGNPNYVPSVIMIGAFLVPVSFTAYLYERMPDWDVPFPSLAACFLWGGVLGTVLAGVFEYRVLLSLGFLPLLGVGLIEEGAKLVVPVAFYLVGRYRSEADGIVLGVATAMGFAALETMGYAFVLLLRSGGNIAVLNTVLLARGLLSPAGHAAWTGLVCSSLWRERLMAGRPVMNRRVVGSFVAAVILHALWDTFNGAGGPAFSGWPFLRLMALLVALVSLALLIRRVREASREKGVSR
ncbi:PrsW family intramembrane metalloprotease [Rubrobacter calidifluminis]|uniref:PrsW family intramembrane metalloprotease n=1 Tax=Rubrobacter calidifluminis TaxID=1392640 RepID=UPI002360E354|nr:PrsW family intramembrane metalloprotease [Rubrobacter calidifluminis]